MNNNFRILVAGLLFISAHHASAVTYNFTGSISTYAGHTGLDSDLHTLIPQGTTFSGSYTIDPTSGIFTTDELDEYGYTTENSRYSVSSFTMNFGDIYLNLSGSYLFLTDDRANDSNGEIAFQDSYILGATYYTGSPVSVDTNIEISDYTSSSINSGYHFRSLRMSITDSTGTLLDGVHLPNTTPDLETYRYFFQLSYGLDCCTGSTGVSGEIYDIQISEVPLPPALWLFLTGVTSLLASTKLKRSISSK